MLSRWALEEKVREIPLVWQYDESATKYEAIGNGYE